jgi:hypothetical protein
MYYCKISVIEALNKDKNTYNGMTPELPAIGKAFFMYVEGSKKYLYTEVIIDLFEKENETIIKTPSVIYSFKNLGRAYGNFGDLT